MWAAAALFAAEGARAQEAPRLTQEEALRLAFPAPAVIERRTAFLSDADLARAAALAGGDAPPTTAVVTYYVARVGDWHPSASRRDRPGARRQNCHCSRE